MAASALTMTQQAYANPCSATDVGEDQGTTDGGDISGNTPTITCEFNDDVIVFEADQGE
jgi:hypothetical protein